MSDIKRIRDHPNYCVSSSGRVYRIDSSGNLISLLFDISNGQQRVKLDRENEEVARLVANAFCEKGLEEAEIVFHIDGDLLNNHYKNLIWLTRSEAKIIARWRHDYRIEHLPKDIDILRKNKVSPLPPNKNHTL